MLKIFEIKIYPFSPDEFAEKIQIAKDKFIAKYPYKSEVELRNMYSNFYGGKLSFEDYSIGYLEILYFDGCLHYEAKLILSKKYSTRKELQSIIDNLDNEKFPDDEMKWQEARRRTGFSYSLIPYKPPLFTEKKHYMSSYHVGGIYSGIKNQTNLEIAEMIKREITRIQNIEVFKGLYFDMSLFNTMCNYIDYLKMFQEK